MTPRGIRRTTWVATALLFAAAACAGHMPHIAQFERPPQLAGEWIDVRHTSPGDTSLWVLRTDGYDGSRHIAATTLANGATKPVTSEHRYGSWYFAGTFADTAHRALCFAKRLGRDGPTCLTFDIDTTTVDGSERRRLTIHGYQGEHHTGDRTLLDRHTAWIQK